ncbi:MAG: AMP-binding protein [bacterium]|nr:AMP-binding protein [bacterium]
MMLSDLQQRLDRSAARVRDADREFTWCEFLQQVEQIPIGQTQIIAPENTLTDAVRVFAGLSGHAPTVLINAREDKRKMQSDAVEFLTHCRAPGVYVSTSGSSGRTKLVRLSPESIWQHAQAVNEHLGACTHDAWLACLPLCHVGGLAILMRAALAGASVRLASANNTALLSALLDDEPITLASFVPTVLRRVVASRGSRRIPARVRAILIGGGPCDVALVDDVPQALRTYGMTETGSMVTCVSFRADAIERASSGKPISGAGIRIVDEQLQDVACGTRGRVVARSAGMASEYVNDEIQTALVYREGWVVTEDEGFLDQACNLHVIGRRDRIVISGGENIALTDIEEALRRTPGVRDAICCGLSDPEWGQIIGAVIESDRHYSIDELRGALKTLLPSFKLPGKVVCVAELPNLPNGKPDYQKACALFGS